ncbi:MAG: DUF177 domain-containing protein [Rhodospirillaceae bacterium]|nr:DUF177 domain-containing protein [Rhodospirillales bacterium]
MILDDETPEFSRPIRVDHIPVTGMRVDVEAKPEERIALAERFGLPSIDLLKAQVHLKAIAGGALIRLDGTITAKVVQACVVSLEPMPAKVKEEFSLTFGAGAVTEEADAEIELSMEDEDPPEPIIDGVIDVGEAVAEHLSLALDPFPRKAGIAFEGGEEPTPAEVKKPSPFAVLAQLRKNKG